MEDPVYRAILAVLALSVIGGSGALFLGEYLFASPALRTAGAAMAVISGSAYFFFLWLGRREARRREADRE